jgi:DNA adenine methylase
VLEDIAARSCDLTQFDCIASPFFGGGSFEFHMQNRRGFAIVANDKFAPLVNFWRSAQTQSDALCTALRAVPPVSKADFAVCRAEVEARGESEPDELAQATRYFVLNRCSFSGATLSGGFSAQAAAKRFTESSIARVAALDLSRTTFSCADFADFLHAHSDDESSRTLIFADPPYCLARGARLYGSNGDMHEDFDHAALAEVLHARKNWMLTYNDCAHVRELYAGYAVNEVAWSYGMNKSKASSEIVIVSN